jgi:hypothetical protein
MKGGQIGRVEAFEDGAQGWLQAIAGQKQSVGGGAGSEPFRHPHP